MTPDREVPGLDAIDWSRPWLAPWRARGEAIASRVREFGLLQALNDAAADSPLAAVPLVAGPVRFVGQGELPAGEPYEAFIARTACIPTRQNLHDFFNALVWLGRPALKRRLNELQAEQLAFAPPGAARGAVRDALTLFDENAALWQGPAVLREALLRRDWHAVFVAHRADWADVQMLVVGHALLEKLVSPRKAITAHAWPLPMHDALAEWGTHDGQLLSSLTTPRLAVKPFLPLPVLGIPGWWPPNESPGFYADPAVFRRPQ